MQKNLLISMKDVVAIKQNIGPRQSRLATTHMWTHARKYAIEYVHHTPEPEEVRGESEEFPQLVTYEGRLSPLTSVSRQPGRSAHTLLVCVCLGRAPASLVS